MQVSSSTSRRKYQGVGDRLGCKDVVSSTWSIIKPLVRGFFLKLNKPKDCCAVDFTARDLHLKNILLEDAVINL